MLVSFITFSSSVFFAFLKRKYNFRQGLRVSFIILFIFLALRYDFGNDYLGYLEIFNQINSVHGYALKWIPEGEKSFEAGWVLLNRFFHPFGFYSMIAFLAAFNCLVIYRFIAKYVPCQYYWLAVFVYVFQPYNMVILSSAMRQNVALLLFVLGIDFLVKRKPIPYLLLIALATLFHSSAFILFPLVLLTKFRLNTNMFGVLLLMGLVLMIYINSESISIYGTKFLLGSESELTTIYMHYITAADTAVTLGTIPIYVIFLIILIKTRNFINNGLIFTNLFIIYFILTFLSLALLMISRLSLYFGLSYLVIIPVIVHSLKRLEFRAAFLGFYILFTLYQFYAFFSSEDWSIKFGSYKTIFSTII